MTTKEMFTFANTLSSVICRGWGLGCIADCRVVFPPFWAGTPAFEVTCGGSVIGFRASPREAYDLLRRALRIARRDNNLGKPGYGI